MTKFFALIALVVLGLTACQSLGTKKDETLQIGPLQKEYKKSKADTRAKYNGKEVSILSNVSSATITADMVRIHLASSTDNELIGAPDVTCVPDKPDFDKFSRTKEGDVIQVKGILSVEDNGMELKSCKKEMTGSN